MSQVRHCDNCQRAEGKIFSAQPSDQRWLKIHRAVWFGYEASDFDFCSWACVEAFAYSAQRQINEHEDAKRPSHVSKRKN